MEGPVLGPGDDQAVEVPDRGEGVAVLLGLYDHRLVPGGIGVRLHGGGVQPAELLEPLAPGRAAEPGDGQPGLHPQPSPGLDPERQVVDAGVGKRLGNGPGAGFAELVDGGDGPAVGPEGDVTNGVPHEPGRADLLIRGRVAQPDRAVLQAEGDQAAIAAKRRTCSR
jgi:hypothetical protein